MMKEIVSVKIQKESSITVEISLSMRIVLHSLLISCVVQVLKEALFKAARDILGQILEKLDEEWRKGKDSSIRICRFVPRTLQTIFGDVRFLYRQAKKDGKCFRPLLEMIGIESHQRITADAKEQAILASLYTSYRKALKIAGCAFSLTTLWSFVQKEGRFYRDKRKKAMWYASQGVSDRTAGLLDFAILMIDEIWIRGRKKKQWLRIKVARLAVARKKDEEYIFEPLRVYATHESQNKFLKNAVQFFDAVAGLSQIRQIVVMSDGCNMGRKFCSFYPGQAVWQLDWWHLWNKVQRGCRFEKGLKEKIWDLLNVEELDEVLEILSDRLKKIKDLENKFDELTGDMKDSPNFKAGVFISKSAIEDLSALITYLKGNRDGIYGVKAHVGKIPGEYLPFGTGPLERLQAVMIAYRMKKQGKHWSIDGAENLVSLLSREWNGEDVEAVLNICIKDLANWEELNRFVESGKAFQVETSPIPNNESTRGKSLHFSAPVNSVVPVLERGKVDGFYRPLRNLSQMKLLPDVALKREMKLLPDIVLKRERRDAPIPVC
jgi:hypothetical protein